MTIKQRAGQFLDELANNQWELLVFVLTLLAVIALIAILVSGRRKKSRREP